MHEFEQGDLLNKFPVVELPTSIADALVEKADKQIEATGSLKTFNVVIMTQSCDLEYYKDTDQVIICPRYDLKEAKNRNGQSLNSKNKWGQLRKGQIVGSYLMKRCDLKGHEFNYQVVDLQRVMTVPYNLVREVASKLGDRVRLLPPYREHLAQAFVRQFMRVGLPIDLPQEFPEE